MGVRVEEIDLCSRESRYALAGLQWKRSDEGEKSDKYAENVGHWRG